MTRATPPFFSLGQFVTVYVNVDMYVNVCVQGHFGLRMSYCVCA